MCRLFLATFLLLSLAPLGLAVSGQASKALAVQSNQDTFYTRTSGVQKAASDLRVRQIQKLAADKKWMPRNKFVKKESFRD